MAALLAAACGGRAVPLVQAAHGREFGCDRRYVRVERIAPEDRRELHHRVASYLQRRSPDAVFELAYHFDRPRDTLPVVYLDIGFIALGVAYNQQELQRFLHGRPDGRWFFVPKSELRKVVPGAEKMQEFR